MAMFLSTALVAFTLLTPTFSQSLSTITAPGGCSGGGSSSSTTLGPSVLTSLISPSSTLPSPASTCSSIPYSGTSIPADTTLDFPTGMLKRHNYLRQFHGSSTPMTWNPALAAAAQTEVNTCVFQHTANNIYGENLAGIARTGGYTPGQLVVSVDEWYGEIAQYDFSNPGFSTATGHFTQLVWLGSSELGCAWKDCTATPLGLYFIACEYAPQGNVANAGYFQANVLPPVASVDSCAAGTTTNPGRVKRGYFKGRRMARELAPFF